MKKYLCLIIFSFLLTACSGKPAETVKPVEVEVVQPVPFVRIIEPAVVEPVEPPPKPFTCDLIVDADRRANCFAEIEYAVNTALASEIRFVFDLMRCDELQGRAIDECKEFILNSGIQGPISVQKAKKLQEALKPQERELTNEETGETEIDLYYDTDTCSGLSRDVKKYCKSLLSQYINEKLLFEIELSGDSARCSELTDEGLKRECENVLGIPEVSVE